MADIDDFASSLLEEAKRFLEKASDDVDDTARAAYLHASLMLAFCSLEAHINAMGEEFATRPELSPHVKGVLLEKEVKLENGDFGLGGLRMYRLEDRILFLHKQFSGKLLDRKIPLWGQLTSAIGVRNKLTHPKDAQPLTIAQVKEAILATMGIIDLMYQAIYKRGFPAAKLGLQAKITF